jgi:hypothetical protein
MSSEERRKILQMVEEGKISAEQAASLMRALEDDSAEADAAEAEVLETGTSSADEQADASRFEEVKSRARRFAMIPLWIGVFISVVSAWAIYAVQQAAGVNFWFFCLLFPLLFGVLLIALGAGGQSSKWLYVNVDRRNTQDWPRNITLGFPLPFGLTAWFLRNFGHHIRGIQNTGEAVPWTNVDEIIQILDATGKSDAPLIINANDNEDGEDVQVYIG